MAATVLFGPWVPGVEAAERKAQLRALAAFVHVYHWEPDASRALVGALRQAEGDAEQAGRIALEMFDALPTLTMRHIVSAFAALHKPRP